MSGIYDIFTLTFLAFSGFIKCPIILGRNLVSLCHTYPNLCDIDGPCKVTLHSQPVFVFVIGRRLSQRKGLFLGLTLAVVSLSYLWISRDRVVPDSMMKRSIKRIGGRKSHPEVQVSSKPLNLDVFLSQRESESVSVSHRRVILSV